MFCKESQSVFVLVSTYLCVCFVSGFIAVTGITIVDTVYTVKRFNQMIFLLFTEVFEESEKKMKKSGP